MAAERTIGMAKGLRLATSQSSYRHGPDRAREFRRARRHTLLVKVLRVLLPLTALGVWSLYVLPHVLPQIFQLRPITIPLENAEITIADVDLSPNELTMVNPRLEGSTANGGRYVVEADQAIQGLKQTDVVRLKTIRATIEDGQTGRATVRANGGVLTMKEERLSLGGDIQVRNERGMTADLRLAYIDLKAQTLHSTQAVEMDLLSGKVWGNTLTLNMKEKRATFENGVRVRIYQRNKAASAEKSQTGAAQAISSPGTSAEQAPSAQ